ncbi:phosphoglycerate mutase [Marinomonas agarivorans]|nr:phosphoglycerate mutase [Marinomonas agarivorans]
MNVYLIRHPKPDVVAGTCYGSMDLALQDGWQQDASQLASWLFPRLTGSTKAYHSPLQRTAKLASFLIPDSVVADSLRELNFADWEGRLWKEIPKSEIDMWANNIVSGAPYNGESLAELADRVLSWWNNILSLNSQWPDNLILVTHSGVIKVLVSQLCCWPLEYTDRISPDFLSITELSVSPNDMHLDNAMVKHKIPSYFTRLKRLGAGDWL